MMMFGGNSGLILLLSLWSDQLEEGKQMIKM